LGVYEVVEGTGWDVDRVGFVIVGFFVSARGRIVLFRLGPVSDSKVFVVAEGRGSFWGFASSFLIIAEALGVGRAE
jgi:hypothetical protein